MKPNCDEYCSTHGCKQLPGCAAHASGEQPPSRDSSGWVYVLGTWAFALLIGWIFGGALEVLS